MLNFNEQIMQYSLAGHLSTWKSAILSQNPRNQLPWQFFITIFLLCLSIAINKFVFCKKIGDYECRELVGVFSWLILIKALFVVQYFCCFTFLTNKLLITIIYHYRRPFVRCIHLCLKSNHSHMVIFWSRIWTALFLLSRNSSWCIKWGV